MNKATEGTEAYYAPSDSVKSDIRAILRTDPTKTQWDTEVLEQLLGKRPTRAVLTSRPVAAASSTNLAVGGTPEEEILSDTSTSKKRRRKEKSPASAALVSPPPTPADASIAKPKGSRKTVPRTRQRAEAEVEGEAQNVAEEEEDQHRSSKRAKVDRSPERAAAAVAEQAEEEQMEEVPEEELYEEEPLEEEEKLETTPQEPTPGRGHAGFFNMVRNFFSTPTKIMPTGTVQEVEIPAALDGNEAEQAQAFDSQLSSAIALDDVGEVFDSQEEPDGGLEEDIEEPVVEETPVKQGGLLSRFWGTGRSQQRETAVETIDETTDGLTGTEIERIRAEASAASERLENLEELLDGIGTSAKVQMTKVTKRFEIEKAKDALCIAELEAELARARKHVVQLERNVAGLEKQNEQVNKRLGTVLAPSSAPSELEQLLKQYESKSASLEARIVQHSGSESVKLKEEVHKLRKDLEASREKAKADPVKLTEKFEQERNDLLNRLAQNEKAARGKSGKVAEASTVGTVPEAKLKELEMKAEEEKQRLQTLVADSEKRVLDANATIKALNGELNAAKEKHKLDIFNAKEASDGEKAQLQTRNQELSNQVTAAAARVMSLETDLIATRRDKDVSQARIVNLLRQVKDAEDAVARAQADLKKKIVEVNDLARQLASRDSAVQRAQERIFLLEKEAADAVGSKLALESELSIVSKEKDALLSRLEKIFATTSENDDRLENTLEELREKSLETAALKRDLASKNVAFAGLQAQISDLQREIDRHKNDRVRLEARIGELSTHATNLEADLLGKIAELDEVKATRSHDSERLKAELADKNIAVRELRKVLEDKESRIEGLEAARQAVAERLKSLEQQTADAISRALKSETAAMSQIETLTRQVDEAQSRNIDLENDASDKVAKIQEAAAREILLLQDTQRITISKLHSSLDEKESKLREMGAEFEKTESKVADKEREIGKLKNDLARIGQQLEGLRKAAKLAQAESTEKDAEIEKLRNELDSLNEHLASLEQEVADKEKEANAAKEALQGVQRECDTLQVENDHLRERERQQLADLKNAQEALQQSADNNAKETARHAALASKLERDLEQTRLEGDKVRNQLASQIRKGEDFQAQIRNLEERLSDNRKEKDAAKAETARYRQLAEAAETRVANEIAASKKLQTDVATKQKELDTLQSVLASKEEEVVSLSTIRTGLEQLLASREEFYNRLRERDSDLVKALESAQRTQKTVAVVESSSSSGAGGKASRRKGANGVRDESFA